MRPDIIKQLILEFQESALPAIVPRDMAIPCDTNKIVTITGVRRSGKTFLLFSLAQHLTEARIPKDRLVYISFDDPRLLPAYGRELETIIESYWELYPANRNKINYLFLDEIQHVRDWEMAVRRIYDTRKFRLFLTGSSSKLLSKDIATSLRGRSINYELLPFSINELLRARGIEVTTPSVYSQDRFGIRNCFEEYFTTGGFPEVALEKSPSLKIRILKEYLETMFFKDLIERCHIRNQMLMRELFKFLISNISSPFSLNAFWKWIRSVHPITKRTLILYLSYLEDSGLVFLVRKFSYSLREQSLRPRKVYIVDNGLRTVYGFRFSQDKGKILENTVYLVLRHLQMRSPLMEIYYWRNGKETEVDFVVKEGRVVRSLIQVCVDPGEFDVKKREIEPLRIAMREMGLKESLVITEDYEAKEKTRDGMVRYVPLWKWVLKGPLPVN
jgi:predicted AAA+ superfamily ATPase